MGGGSSSWLERLVASLGIDAVKGTWKPHPDPAQYLSRILGEIQSVADTLFDTGLLWWYAFRHGYWHNRRCLGHGYIREVSAPLRVLALLLRSVCRAFGLEGLSKDAAATLSANIVSALQAGCFLGAVIAWPLADFVGRKPSLIVSSLVAGTGICIQAASSGHLAAMYVGRYIDHHQTTTPSTTHL